MRARLERHPIRRERRGKGERMNARERRRMVELLKEGASVAVVADHFRTTIETVKRWRAHAERAAGVQVPPGTEALFGMLLEAPAGAVSESATVP